MEWIHQISIDRWKHGNDEENVRVSPTLNASPAACAFLLLAGKISSALSIL